MLQNRLYRAALLFGVFAVVVLLFAVVSRPDPLASEASLEPFDEAVAASDTRQLMDETPERLPGSADNLAAAALVASGFQEMDGGTVEEVEFEARYEGDRVAMANVIYTLPGETDELIVVTAARDCAGGPCAASSAASTAALLELARGYSRGHHRKSVMFVSTDGSVAGAAGAKELVEYLEDRPVTAVVVLSGAGLAEPIGRTVVPWSSSTRGTSIQLVLSAERAVRDELDDRDPLPRGTFSELVRLAIPAGLGEQAPLIAAGFDAVGLAGGGPRPIPGVDDESFSTLTLGAMGRTALALTRAIDAGPGQLEAGPRSRVPLAGKVVPGWALSLLAAALLIPLGVVAVDATARALRARSPLLSAIAWVLSRGVPFLAALLVAALLAVLRLVPAPAFPFDPSVYTLDLGASLTLALLVAIAVAVLIAMGRYRPVPESGQAGTAAIAVVLFLAGVAVWLVNPYLALAAIPTLHLWLWASAPLLRGGIATRLVLCALGLAWFLAVCAVLAAQFGTGLTAVPWQLLMLYTGGHFAILTAIPVTVLAGCLVATVQVGRAEWTDVRVRPPQASRRRRPIHHPRNDGREKDRPQRSQASTRA